MVRLFSRERADAVEAPADRAAAMAQLTAYLLMTATSAHTALYPSDRLPTSPSPTVASSSGPVVFSDPAEARVWFEQEHANVLRIVRQQAAAGQCLEEVRDLSLTAIKFLTVAGYAGEQEQFGRLAIEVVGQLEDKPGSAYARNVLGVAMMQQGRPREAVVLLEQSLALQRELGDRLAEAACLNNLGNAVARHR